MPHVRLTATILIVALASWCRAAPASGDELPGLALDPDELQLLPLTHHEWQLFYDGHRPLIDEMYGLRWQARQLAREDRARERWDAVEREALEARARELNALLLVELSPWQVTAERLHQIAQVPAGPGQSERYAHQVVLGLADLAAPEREGFLARVAGALDAAATITDQLAEQLREHRQAAQALEAYRGQQWGRERRFWLLVDCVLDDAQRREVCRWLPRSLQEVEDLRGHLRYVPGLTPTQGARLEAVIAEYDSEAAADDALTRKLQERMKAPDLAPEERQRLQQEELTPGYQRLNALRHRAYHAACDALEPAQVAYLEAIPPRVHGGDRVRRPRELLANFDLDDAQLQALADLELWQRRHDARVRRRSAEMKEALPDTGPDSPQAQGMQMMQSSAEGSGRDELRRLLGRAFTEVLAPEQVVRWVVARQ